MGRFTQAISEGDGISVVAHVRDTAAAREAEANGAEGLVLAFALPGVADATDLPILWWGTGTLHEARESGAHACVIVAARDGDEPGRLEQLQAEAYELELECVVEVTDEEELETVLERLDPEILLLSHAGEARDDALGPVLDVLSGVPAGKLVLAALPSARRDDVAELERAGVDGVIVPAEYAADVVGAAPLDV